MSKKAKLNEKFKGDYLAMDTVEKLANEQKPKSNEKFFAPGICGLLTHPTTLREGR